MEKHLCSHDDTDFHYTLTQTEDGRYVISKTPRQSVATPVLKQASASEAREFVSSSEQLTHEAGKAEFVAMGFSSTEATRLAKNQKQLIFLELRRTYERRKKEAHRNRSTTISDVLDI